MNLPKLRFKEFRDNWLSSELDKIATTSSGGTPNRSKPEYWGGSIPWVTTSLIDFNVINNSDEFITEEGLKNSSAKLFPKDTLLMAMYGQGKTRGKVAILGLEASTNQACAAITFHQNTINIRFAFQNLAGRYDEIRDLSNAGGQENLSAGLIKQIKITFPSLPEQTKIANFLTAIDEKISQLTQKYDLLKQYKKGIMQQIFSQKLRFKDDDGREFPEWEIATLEDVSIKYYQGINTAADKIEYFDGGVPIIQAKHITGEYLDFSDARGLNEIDYQKYKDKYNPKINDLLISNIGTLGKIVLVESNIDFLIAWNIFKVTLNTKNCYPRFIKEFLKKISSDGYFESIKTGNATKFINKSDMLAINIDLPSIAEQTKIANFLTAIDDKITQAQTQLDAVKLYKKGLLQQLFV